MGQPNLSTRLSSLDATFLYFEKKEAPMHIGSVSIFEGEIPFKKFRKTSTPVAPAAALPAESSPDPSTSVTQPGSSTLIRN